MKRVANKVAVQTILYVLPGYQKIRIIDYKNDGDLYKRENGEVVYDGKCYDPTKTFSDYCRLAKYERSQLHGLYPDGETLVFEVATVFEEY